MSAKKITYKTDVLVVGAGLAGLTAALRAATIGATVIVANLGTGASPYVNGFRTWHGGASEDFEIIRNEMLEKGENLNDPQVTNAGITRSRTAYPTLLKYGVPFVLDEKNDPVVKSEKTKAGVFPRGYSTKGELGKNALPALKAEAKKHGVVFLDDTEILVPVTENGQMVGAIGVHDQEYVFIQAKSVILACGGLGSLIKGSTYPKDVTGGYVLMALLAGAELVDMEFLQYEPAVCCGLPQMGRMPLPTGFWKRGAQLLNKNGERFFKTKYNLDETDFSKYGATDKNLIARRIYWEIQEGNGLEHGGIWYDATRVAPERINQFTFKVKRLASVGVDMSKTPIEICPGAHSHTGGVRVDEKCASRVKGLFAAGESAGGFLGAGRMSGFGGTSAVVLGDLAGESAAEYALSVSHADELNWMQAHDEALEKIECLCNNYDITSDTYNVISEILDRCFNIAKSEKLLREGLDIIDSLKANNEKNVTPNDLPAAIKAYGAICTAKILFETALIRTESRGAFYREDYPDTKPQWQASQTVEMNDTGELHYSVVRRNEINQ